MGKEIVETKKQETDKKNIFPKWLKLGVLFFLITTLLIIATGFGIAFSFQNKIFPGITVAGLDLSGQTAEQAQKVLTGKFKEVYGSGFSFSYEENLQEIDSSEILKLEEEETINYIFSQTQKEPFFKNSIKTLYFFVFKKDFPFKYSLDKEKLKEKLSENFSILEKPAIDSQPQIKIIDKEKKTFTIEFNDEKDGELFSFKDGINQLEQSFNSFQNPQIQLQRQPQFPLITKIEAQTTVSQIEDFLKKEKVELYFEEMIFPILWESFPEWLTLKKDSENQILLTLKEEMVKNYLLSASQKINRKPQDAKLQIVEGKVTEFIDSQNGREIDIENSTQKIISEIFQKDKARIELIVVVTLPEITVEKTNELGIKELLGTGHSNFAGSPTNRRHNISIGAQKINGMIIQPNTEFSLVKSLGEIDAENGYLPELVIKKEGTVPEYGGGLCQVATTIFRGALQSGLKITQRKNHSYRVSYYEPAGTDATIYNPWPDFRFFNDTPNNLLIQAKIIGDDLYFHFWGTADGREVLFEGLNKTTNLQELKPKIFNITNPGPALEILTTALSPGVRKQTEKPHAGASASFDRYIKFSNGEEEKESFNSHYIPWRAVFMVGAPKEEIPVENTSP